MRRQIAILLVGVMFFILTGCGGNEKVYYSKYQSIGLYSPKDVKQFQSSLNWGEKLTYLDKTSVFSNAKNEAVLYLLFKRETDGKSGYVNQANVIHKPVSTAVILGQVVAYDSPSAVAMNKVMITPPTLCFLLEQKDKEWGKIEIYNISEEYAIVPSTAKIYGAKWVQLKDISTKQADVNMVLSAGFAVKNFNDAKAAYGASPTDANQEKINKVVMAELESLKSQITAYPTSPAVIYAQQVMNMLSPEETGESPVEEESDTNSNEQL